MSHEAMETRLAMLRRVGGDRLIRDLIDLLLESTPQKLAAAHAALADGDTERIGRIAHALASSAGNLGMADMQEAAYALERNAVHGLEHLPELLGRLQGAWEQARGLLTDRKRGLNP